MRGGKRTPAGGRPAGHTPANRVRFRLDDETAGWLRAAANHYGVEPEALLWRLVRHALKGYVFNGHMPKEILASLEAEKAAGTV